MVQEHSMTQTTEAQQLHKELSAVAETLRHQSQGEIRWPVACDMAVICKVDGKQRRRAYLRHHVLTAGNSSPRPKSSLSPNPNLNFNSKSNKAAIVCKMAAHLTSWRHVVDVFFNTVL